MKLLMIIFNFAIRDKIEACLNDCELKSYTLIPEVHGSGKSSGKHFESHIWPGKNNIIMIALPDQTFKELKPKLQAVKEKYKTEGMKFFLIPLEEII
ncbi:MAG TPA: hypothetical protein ENN73_03530 [Firmicutes bacterium]|nr:hypothetical protein [Bacillota bacterium]